MHRPLAAPVRHALVSCAVLVIACLADPAWAKELSAESIFRDAREYTVRIRGQIERPFIEDDEGSYAGAGFLVDSERGWIVTNAHVAAHSPAALQVAFADGRFQPARKIYVDSFSDIAIIAVASGTRGRRVARLQCGQPTRVGESVGVFGHPIGLTFTGTRGIVAGHTDQLGVDFIQTDAAIDGGNSGGPVMRLSDGRVVGVATATIEEDESAGSNFVTPASEVCRILELLRAGVEPDPMRMPFTLLVDDDGRHTMRVGESYDPERWPFQPDDLILAIEGSPDTVGTLGELVTALRGRAGSVKLRVERDGKPITIHARPERRESVMARRGISIDGALIAPADHDDDAVFSRPMHLIVHSVESGSTASSLRIAVHNSIESLDGRRFTDIGSLRAYLHGREAGQPLRIVFRRVSPLEHRFFDYHVRELPGTEIEEIGEGVEVASDGE